MTVVQDPLDAQAPHMPINAIRAVEVDHVVPISEMGNLLVQIVNQSAQEGEVLVPGEKAFSRLQTEVRIALEDNGLEQEIIELGSLSPYTCPDCHGSLIQIIEGNITRFRCHTGHAFTLDALLSAITQSCETTLWNAVRVLQEAEMLTGHLSKHLDELGDDDAALAYLQRKVQVMRQADLVRQALLQDEKQMQINESGGG